jgi:hypothetical protein
MTAANEEAFGRAGKNKSTPKVRDDAAAPGDGGGVGLYQRPGTFQRA